MMRSGRRAFSLVELLIGAALMSLIFIGLAEVTFKSFEVLHFIEDVRVSGRRAGRVFELLRMPLEHCGYGMPKEPNEFRRAFGSMDFEPFNCSGAFSIPPIFPGVGAREKSECVILFGIGTDARVVDEINTSDSELSVRISTGLALLEPCGIGHRPLSVKNWVLFGAMLPELRPLFLKTVSSGGTPSGNRLLGLSSPTGEQIFIPMSEEPFYLRAFRCRVKRGEGGDSIFNINDYTGSGDQPRVEGVIDARFDYDPVHHLVTVNLLVRGDNRSGEKKSTGAVKGWRDEYTSDIPEDARYYRLFAYKRTFHLKNF